MELKEIPVVDKADVGHARRVVRKIAEQFPFSAEQLAHLELIATELASNLTKHRALEGRLQVGVARELGQISLTIFSCDRGPGIPDPIAAMQDGFSTRGSLGIGLGAVSRHADEFALFSRAARRTDSFLRTWTPTGTIVVARKWLSPPQQPWQVFAYTKSCSGETYNGDGYELWAEGDRLRVLACDGLGHGLGASQATIKALAAFRENPAEQLLPLLTRIHEALRGTRGGAVLLAEIDQTQRRLSYVAVGNISLRVYPSERNVFLPSRGILGVGSLPPLQLRQMEWTPDSTCCVFSDGLSGRWVPEEDKEFFSTDLGVVGQMLLRDHSRDKDDTTLVMVRERAA